MASGKRQPSKKKRSSQNRQQRAALQARKQAAQAPQAEASAEPKRSRWRSAPATPARRRARRRPRRPPPRAPAAAASAPAAPTSRCPERAPGAASPSARPSPRPSLLGPPARAHLGQPPGRRHRGPPRASPPARPARLPERPVREDRAVRTAPTPAGRPAARPRRAPRRSAGPRLGPAASRGRPPGVAAQRQRRPSPPATAPPWPVSSPRSAAVLLCVFETTPVDHAGNPYTGDRIVAEWAGPGPPSADHLATRRPPSRRTAKAVTDGVKAAAAASRARQRLIQALLAPVGRSWSCRPSARSLTFQAVRRRRGARRSSPGHPTPPSSACSCRPAWPSTSCPRSSPSSSPATRCGGPRWPRSPRPATSGGDVIDAEVVDG